MKFGHKFDLKFEIELKKTGEKQSGGAATQLFAAEDQKQSRCAMCWRMRAGEAYTHAGGDYRGSGEKLYKYHSCRSELSFYCAT